MRIINGYILTMADRIFENGYVAFENGKITAVGPMEDITAKADDYDAGGRYVGPGFVDIHTHMGMRGTDDLYDPITPHIRAIDGIDTGHPDFHDAANAGVTTVVCLPGSNSPISGQGTAVKTAGRNSADMLLKDRCAVKMALGENTKSGGKSGKTRMENVALIKEALKKAKLYQAKLERGEEAEPDIKSEALLPLLRGEVAAVVHAHRADDLYAAIGIAKEFGIRVVLHHASEARFIADEIKAAGCSVAIGPILMPSSKFENSERSLETPRILHEAGISCALITDHAPGVSIGIKIFPVIAAYSVREGLDEMEALKMVTIGAARIGELDDRVGSLEIGKDADIVVFGGKPLDYTKKTKAVFVNGIRVK